MHANRVLLPRKCGGFHVYIPYTGRTAMTIATAIVTGSIGEQSIEVPAKPTAGVRGSGMPSIGFSLQIGGPTHAGQIRFQ